MTAQNGLAKMYTYVDSKGKTHYTNAPNRKSRLYKPSLTSQRRPGTIRYPRVSGYSGHWNGSYDHYIDQVANRYNIDPHLIRAVIKTESNFNRFAQSRKGAQGLMQLMPGTANDLNVRNPFNPVENIDGGTRYLRNLLNDFNGDLVLSLAAYNAGPTRVKQINRVPRIPETVRYVSKVLAYYKGYKGKRVVIDTGAAPSVIRVGEMVTVR
ncbi:MAG: lytic transglycosylase domain-containing protein [Thermodesulfobacteriota bacterium]